MGASQLHTGAFAVCVDTEVICQSELKAKNKTRKQAPLLPWASHADDWVGSPGSERSASGIRRSFETLLLYSQTMCSLRYDRLVYAPSGMPVTEAPERTVRNADLTFSSFLHIRIKRHLTAQLNAAQAATKKIKTKTPVERRGHGIGIRHRYVACLLVNDLLI